MVPMDGWMDGWMDGSAHSSMLENSVSDTKASAADNVDVMVCTLLSLPTRNTLIHPWLHAKIKVTLCSGHQVKKPNYTMAANDKQLVKTIQINNGTMSHMREDSST